MTSLSRLPLEVFEHLSPLLRIHHLGRLYMTGDKTLQTLLQNIRKRRFKFSGVSSQPSEMVRRVLAGTAADVETEVAHMFSAPFDRSLFPRLTRLVLDDNDGPQVSFNSDLDFSWIRTLEHLDIGKAYVVFKTIKLPPSITTVKFGAVASVKPIHDHESLPWLRTLSVAGYPFVDDTVLPYFAATSSSWPELLTSLTVVTKSVPNQFVPHVPNTVTSMTLTMGGGDFPVDLYALCRRCKSLTWLQIRHGQVRMSRPLPSRLTTLHLNSLTLNAGDTLLETFKRLPPNLRAFTCFFFTRSSGAVAPLDAGDTEAALRLIIPRLTLKSAEILMGAAMRSSVHFSQDFSRFISGVLESHGLRVGYLQWKNLDTLNWDVSSPQMAHVLDNAVSEEAALRVIKRRCQPPIDTTYSPNNEMSGSYKRHCYRMLELGLTNVLHVPYDLGRLFALSQQSIFNLVTMRIDAIAIDSFKRLVQFNKLVCLEKIEVLWESPVTDVVLLTIHQYRANLPRLEQVVLPWLPHTRAVRKACALLKKDMRLHLAEDGYGLVYRVSERTGSRLNGRRPTCANLLRCAVFALVVAIVFAIFR